MYKVHKCNDCIMVATTIPCTTSKVHVLPFHITFPIRAAAIDWNLGLVANYVGMVMCDGGTLYLTMVTLLIGELTWLLLQIQRNIDIITRSMLCVLLRLLVG